MATAAEAQQDWTWRSSGTTQTLRGVSLMQVSESEQLFVAVGDGGTILTSPEGFHWVAQNSGTSASLTGIAGGNALMVAVGQGGVILSSPDGFTWTTRSSSGPNLTSVAWWPNGYIAVGDGGAFATSPDGVVWTWGNVGAPVALYGVGGASPEGGTLTMACGQGGALYIVVSQGGAGPVTFTPAISGTSADLQAIVNGWDDGVVGDGDYLGMLYTNGNWTMLSGPVGPRLRAVTTIDTAVESGTGGSNFVNDEYIIAVGDYGSVFYSIGAGGPVLATGVPNTSTLYGVATDTQNIAVAVGEGGSIATSPLTTGIPTASFDIANPASVNLGGTVQLSNSITGWGPLTYQWYFKVLHVLLWVQQGAGRTGGWRNQLTSITGAC
ncbi:MAG TPA: hypothetical protein VGL42_11610 [Opitutaceae bacterium]